MGKLYLIRGAHDQQQYSKKLWHSNNAYLELTGQENQENIPHTTAQPPPAWTANTKEG